MEDWPNWALIAVWLATLTGTYYLSREMIKRFA